MKKVFVGFLLGFFILPAYGDGYRVQEGTKKNEEQAITKKIIKVRQEKARENQEQSFRAKEALEKNRKTEIEKK